MIEKMINELFLILLLACPARVQLSRCGLTICAMPTQLLREKPRNICLRMQSNLGAVFGRNSPLIAHTKLKTSRNVTARLARQSFGIFNHVKVSGTFRVDLALE